MDKRFTAAVLSGLVCPGAGQIYKGQYRKGWALVAAAVGIVTAVLVKAWAALIDAALSMPPEEVLKDVFSIAHRVLASDSRFFGWAGWAFLAVWAYGLADALFSNSRRPA